MKVKFTAHAHPTAKSAHKARCVGTIIHNERLDMAAMAEELARTSQLGASTAHYYLSLVRDYILSSLAAGNRLDFGDFALELTFEGTLDGANAKFDPAKNSIGAALRLSKKAKARLATLKPQNATPVPEPEIASVVDSATRAQDTVTQGAKILLAGKNLLVDPERDDEGVELRDETTGETLCTGEVLKSSMTTLDCVFASPLANGRYRLAVRTRAAQSAKVPSVATRAIAFRHTG